MNEPDIIEIFSEVVKNVSEDLEIIYTDGKGNTEVLKNLPVNFIFGSGQYVKDVLDVTTKSDKTAPSKFPLVALFCPINEERDNTDYFAKAKVSLVIACSSSREWSNEQRHVTSFKNILRPIYNRLIKVLLEDNRFDWGYEDKVKHSYSENYSYGRYGAFTESGEAVSETIDAINIKAMEIIINNPNCR
ncbi:hypothetical protein [Bacteroides sp.]|uniref:hypothetical protein n=1 Tax=Bacteroides sp. TaxID=29523 RepID=UPI0026016D05|nr:hypothetical protein [Bacteroides sp.]